MTNLFAAERDIFICGNYNIKIISLNSYFWHLFIYIL